MGQLLESINAPEDLKKIPVSELPDLCAEIRRQILQTVSENGGHLASNLGAVELTVALHRTFDVPQDVIIWDVGHQAYTHKLLTGRREQFGTIRKKDGLSGFPNREESVCDAFSVGHASTSISAALGFATAKALRKEEGYVVAVIGDGALTGGLAYEGLNNAGRLHRNFIVILNDNEMSISRNVGSISRYLAHIRTTPGYLRAKGNVETILDHIPKLGKPLHHGMTRMKNLVKHIIYGSNFFENLGFTYYGPFDGHDVRELSEVLENAKKINKPVLLHVLTSKGKGYPYAEDDPGLFHGLSGFDLNTGKMQKASPSFSSVFGATLCEIAGGDDRICAVTAAMKAGTGLTEFARKYPKRFFDTGIAEEHALTFSGALAAGNMHPVFAVYSTFLQRSYDQILHDAALQHVDLTLAIDRAGVVGDDGETHQGVFDAAFLNTVPGATVYSPAYFDELRLALQNSIYRCKGVSAVRYPRGGEGYRPADFTLSREPYQVYGSQTSKRMLVTYGRLFSAACLAQKALQENGIEIAVLKLNRIRPLDPAAAKTASSAEEIFFFEEGIRQGGVGEAFADQLLSCGFPGKFHLYAIDNTFVKHASVSETLHALGLDEAGMESAIQQEILQIQNRTEKQKIG